MMLSGKLSVVIMTVGVVAVSAAPQIRNLAAQYRAGQVFLTWKEAELPEDSTLNVYTSPRPVTDSASLDGATLVCRWIEPHSAEDWTRDKGNYGKGRPRNAKTGKRPEALTPVGFRITEGGARLDPTSGLHVHTITPGEEGKAYYAITTVKDGVEDRAVSIRDNSLAEPVDQHCEPIQPIWQDDGPPRNSADGKDKALHLQLHAKGNRPACKYIVFGDATHAWREGIPFMFDVAVDGDVVSLLPSNTMYVGRHFDKGIAGSNKVWGIWTFWYGCSDRIPEPEKIPEGTPTNYSERRLLFELSWVQETFGTDPNRVYCSGSSMGGCGTMSFGFRHPEIFAAVSAHVPIVAYNEGDPEKGAKLGWQDNTFRLKYFCGSMENITSDGLPLRQRLDASQFVTSHPGDLPFLVLAHGRQDMSIPWHNNPVLYRALQDTKHGCIVAWNEGSHPQVAKLLPADFAAWQRERLLRFALNKSFPAFSHCSADGNPGNGDSNNGDTVGYMNRGLDWDDAVESPTRYEIRITCNIKIVPLPVTVDVTPRRCQEFTVKPGEHLVGINLDNQGAQIEKRELVANEHGQVTFGEFRITDPNGNRMVLSK